MLLSLEVKNPSFLLASMTIHLRGMQVPYELHKRVIEVTLALYRVTDFFPRDEVLRRTLRESANGVFAGVAEAAFAEHAEGAFLAVCGRVETILGYLKIARSLAFVRAVNITVLEREYQALEEMLSDFLDELMAEKSGSARSSFHEPVDGSILEPDSIVESSLPKGEEGNKGNGERKSSVSAKAPLPPKMGVVSCSVLDKKLEGLTNRQEEILTVLKNTPQIKLGDLILMPHFSGVSAKTIQRDLQYLLERKIIQRKGEKRWAFYGLS